MFVLSSAIINEDIFALCRNIFCHTLCKSVTLPVHTIQHRVVCVGAHFTMVQNRSVVRLSFEFLTSDHADLSLVIVREVLLHSWKHCM